MVIIMVSDHAFKEISVHPVHTDNCSSIDHAIVTSSIQKALTRTCSNTTLYCVVRVEIMKQI